METAQGFIWRGKVTFQECRTKKKNVFIITSFLKVQTFSDTWEVNVLFWCEFFSSLCNSRKRIHYFFFSSACLLTFLALTKTECQRERRRDLYYQQCNTLGFQIACLVYLLE